jgi:hypothetical protein
MQINADGIQYKDIHARHIVLRRFWFTYQFYFNQLPLDGTKELFYHKSTGLDLDVINTSVFILPLGNNCFKVGATYNWKIKPICLLRKVKPN